MNSEKKFYPYIFHPRRGYQGLVTEIKNEKFLSRNEIETKPKKKKRRCKNLHRSKSRDTPFNESLLYAGKLKASSKLHSISFYFD